MPDPVGAKAEGNSLAEAAGLGCGLERRAGGEGSCLMAKPKNQVQGAAPAEISWD